MADERVAIFAHETLNMKRSEDWAYGTVRATVLRAIGQGMDTFLSPVTKGLCLRITGMIADMADCRLITYLPYHEYGTVGMGWSERDANSLKVVLEKADKVMHCDEVRYNQGERKVLDKGVHSWGKVLDRIRMAVEDSLASIIVYDGRQYGLTSQAFQYARDLDKKIYWINPVVKKAKWI